MYAPSGILSLIFNHSSITTLEASNIYTFLEQLYSHTPTSYDNDGLWWQLKKNGFFDIRSFYTIRDSPKVVFSWKSVWRSKAPRRVFFLYDYSLR